HHPDAIEQKLLYKKTDTNWSIVKALIDKSLLQSKQVEVYRNPYDQPFSRTTPLPLTEEQQMAIRPMNEAIANRQHEVFLLHGVTGSGKTEIYLQTIEDVIKRREEEIVLVPEISLTPQMVKRFKARFASNVAVLHSGLSDGEKYDEWRKVVRKEVQVVVG